MNDIKNFACHKLYWNIDSFQGQSVVSVNDRGEVISFQLLDEEIRHTEWIGGVIILSPMIELSMARDFKTLLNDAFREKNDSHLYAWHVSHFDFTNENISSQSTLRKLH